MWLSGWSNITWNRPQDRVKIYIYVGLVCGSALLIYLSAVLVLRTAITSTSAIHGKMISRILKAPVLFFDTNPAGRILNRFSKDIGIMDELLPIELYYTSCLAIKVINNLIVPAIVNSWVILPVVPLLVVGVYYGRRYVIVSREVARIQALSYSFLLTQFSNTKEGLELIRTYGKQRDVTQEFYRLVDLFSLSRWSKFNPSSLKPFSQTYSLKGDEGWGNSFDPSPRFSLCVGRSTWDLPWMLIGLRTFI